MENKDLEKYYLQIDAYLNGDLDGKELEELKLAMRNNSELADSVKSQIDARANIRILAEQKEKEQFLKQFEEEEEVLEPTIKKEIPRISLWKVASVAAVFLALLVFYFYPYQKNSSEFVLDNYLSDPSVSVLRTETTPDLTKKWMSVNDAFLNKNYQKVLTELEGIKEDSETVNKHGGKIALYEGISFLRLRSLDKSLLAFRKIKQDNPFYDQRQWYEALTLLEQGNEVKAKNIFVKIGESPNHFKRKEAVQILNQIK